jgi:UDP-N-acetylglucosamine 4,6-dehydratase
MTDAFNNSILMITGGTGSFGQTVLKRFLKTQIKEIRIFSRDEKKQDDIRKIYRDPRVTFYIGDVRDEKSLAYAMGDVDYLFHAAALKQVPSCEFHPMQAVKTNVHGTDNVIHAAIQNKVRKVICLSTDKAVYPINVMGMTKAIMEKVVAARARHLKDSEPVLCSTRYGNVMASRGSVIPLFVDQITKNQPLTITDPHMTRFMMSLDDAMDLVLYAFQHGQSGDLFVQKAPAANINVLAKAVCLLMGKPDHPIHIIGTRHGEKLYETLLSREEMALAQDCGDYYRVPPDTRDLNYDKFFSEGEKRISASEDYNSHSTQQLDVEAMLALLKTLPFAQDILQGKPPEFAP